MQHASPDSTHTDVLVIGSGFAGLGTAIALQRAGRTDYVVLEQAERLGGTWHHNHYPGCACDVPTPYYSFSFAPKPDWSRFYAPHHEIRLYLEGCADRFGVRPKLRFNQTVTGATWDDGAQRWHVTVDGGPDRTARVLVAAPGGLSRPAFPDLDGLGDFAGPWFHSAQWDHDVDLTGARVAVVGTGASAIQFVPEVARTAGHVDVFQRTAPWVLPKPDRRIPRVEQALYRAVPAAQRVTRALVWAMQEVGGLGNTVDRRFTRPLELVGRAWIRRHIADPQLRAQLTPDFAIGCKRILLSNDWYATLAQDHVDVVADGIDGITADGVLTRDGILHRADVLVFGTGFQATNPVGDLPLRGRGGVGLDEVWRDGMRAHRGTTVAGFPNFFLLPGPNTGTGHTSQVFMIEQQIAHTLALLDRMDARGAAAVEPDAQAQARFNARLQEQMQQTVWLQGGCTSWYLDEHGRNTTLWPFGSLAFRRELRTIDEAEFHFDAPRAVPAAPAETTTTTGGRA